MLSLARENQRKAGVENDARAFLHEANIDPTGVEEVDGKVMSAFVRARKPLGK